MLMSVWVRVQTSYIHTYYTHIHTYMLMSVWVRVHVIELFEHVADVVERKRSDAQQLI